MRYINKYGNVCTPLENGMVRVTGIVWIDGDEVLLITELAEDLFSVDDFNFLFD